MMYMYGSFLIDPGIMYYASLFQELHYTVHTLIKVQEA